MPNTQPPITRLPAGPMSMEYLMGRLMPEMQNYESEVLPLLRLWGVYKQGFVQSLQQVPGSFYAVANFNLRGIEPDWCRQRLNYFDMKIAHRLHGKNWSMVPDSERLQWIAVPERAAYLHYNSVWSIPIQHQERFLLEAPGIWRKVVPSGQFDVHVIGEGEQEPAAVRTYTGKTFNPVWTINHTILSGDLRRKK